MRWVAGDRDQWNMVLGLACVCALGDWLSSSWPSCKWQ